MGGRQSTAAPVPADVSGGHHGGRPSSSSIADNVHVHQGHHSHHQASSSSQGQARHRAVSAIASSTAVSGHHRGFPVSISTSNGGTTASGGSPDSDDSTPDDDPLSRAMLGSSLPVHLFSLRDIKCPVCSKMVPADDVECHVVMCLTRPRINYNEDVLLEDKDECVICLEELHQGDTIARLPCLCIYHKSCIDQWFKVKRSCPEHPND